MADSSEQKRRPRKGEELDLEIHRLAFGGSGVGRTEEGLVVFVEDALPGQRVRARLGKVMKRFAEARVVEVLEQTPLAVEARCAHFGPCGGCRLQHLDYEAQLSEKTSQVSDALIRLGGFVDPPVRDALRSPDLFNYRNKMEYSFGDRRWLTPAEMAALPEESLPVAGLGLHPRGRWDRVIHLQECHLPDPRSLEVLHAVQERTASSRLGAYTTRTHEGFWRFLVVRQGVRTGQWMVDLITAPDTTGSGEVDALARHLVASFPWLTTITHTVNRSLAAVATGDEMRILHGPGYIEEEVGGLSFRVSPRAFFQTNTRGAERLYQSAVELAGLTGSEVVWDVYCGTGTIALLMAGGAARVVGFEVEPSAVVDARANAERNGIASAEFVEGDAVRIVEEPGGRGRPDVLVLDPPRAGLHPDVCAAVPRLGAERLVYVSCNPTTLARDLKEICMSGYRLEVVQPVDMFPHTPHIESACLLTRSR